MYAFVLRRTDLREQDQMIALYTLEKGKVDCLARGLKKILSKNSAFLEPFFLIDVELVPGKDIIYLTKAVPVFVYKNILDNLEKMLMLQTVFRWLSDLTSHERELKIFLLVKNWLEYLDKDEKVSSALAYGFLGNILIYLGFEPDLQSCVFCQIRENLVAFYPSAGGVICKKCFVIKKQADVKIYPLRAVDLSAIRLLFSNDWDKIVENNTEIANRLVFLYAQYHSEKKLIKISTLI